MTAVAEHAGADAMAAALADPAYETFTRAQVADLIARALGQRDDLDDAYRAGYERGFRDGTRQLESDETARARVHHDWVYATRQWMDRVDARRKADREGQRPRRGGYRGGPVEVW